MPLKSMTESVIQPEPFPKKIFMSDEMQYRLIQIHHQCHFH